MAQFEPGTRVLIVGGHPASGITGTVRKVQQLSRLFGGGIGYAVEIDGAAGHECGCRASDLMIVPAPPPKRKPKR